MGRNHFQIRFEEVSFGVGLDTLERSGHTFTVVHVHQDPDGWYVAMLRFDDEVAERALEETLYCLNVTIF